MTDEHNRFDGFPPQRTLAHVLEVQATIQGIAEVLARESGRTVTECWTEALSLYRVQFETVVLPPPSERRSHR